jgi:hypothetical protein
MVQKLKCLLFSFQLILLYNCAALKNTDEKFFTFKESFYQSWLTNDNEKGTNIYVVVVDIKPGVVFDSMVFRGVKLPLSLEEKNGQTQLKSVLHKDMSVFQNEKEITGLPDQLIFHYNNMKNFFLLTDIRRVDMKYY